MSEWWAYQPSDLLMFSPETYYRLFELYNMALWPAQILTLAAGVSIATLMVRGPRWRGRVVATLLALAWFFVAWGYFIDRYATINLAAPYFALGFVVQAVLLVVVGLSLGRIAFDDIKTPTAKAGIALFFFALVFQPLIGPLIGREWSGMELFGLAPDPTVVGTLGVLLAADRIRWELFVIPVLWCAITGATLWIMKSQEAFLMPLIGLLSLILAARHSLKTRRELAGDWKNDRD
jgi:multisubunit Na+/H+ antiporter MnhF subunit